MKAHSELILTNGIIRTQDKQTPVVSTVLISDGRIRAIGDDSIRAMADSGAPVIDLNGRTMLPGMTDPHFHYYEWALNRRNLALANAGSLDDLIRRVRAAAKTRPEGNWIIGQGWNEADWTNRIMPNRDMLDQAAPRHPVILWRCDLHLAVVNSPALSIAGISRHTSDPPEGKIERDSSGRPSGILKESAIRQVRAMIPALSDQDIVTAFHDGIPALHSLGLTGIHDARLMNDRDGASAFRAWYRLRETGHLNLRCRVTIPGEQTQAAIDLGLRTGFGDDRLCIGHLKFFADGGMGARTAWMTEPYLDADTGMPLIPTDELDHLIRSAHSAGLSVMIHAVGDRANHEVISIFERLPSHPSPSPLHRVEHVQMILPEDIKRLAELNVAACVQPHNMILDMNMIDEAVGARGCHVYAFKTLIDANIPVMIGSDAPVCDPSPMVNIHAAVTRQRKDKTPDGGWYPDQRITVDDAVKAYTLVPAQVHGIEDSSGSISPGKYADLIVLDRDIYTIDPADIADAKVEMTVFDGEIVMDCR